MTKTNKPARLVFVLLCLAAMAACSLPGPSRSPGKHLYVLQDAAASGPASAPSRACVSLRVNTPGSAPGLNTSRMAYRTEPNRLDYFAYHEWAATPARMIVAIMESRLGSSGLFSAVLAGSPDIRTDWRLDSEVLAFQQDFTGNGSVLNFSIRITLVDVAARDLAKTQTFSYQEPAGENAEGGVAAANRAVAHFLDDLTAFLASAESTDACGG